MDRTPLPRAAADDGVWFPYDAARTVLCEHGVVQLAGVEAPSGYVSVHILDSPPVWKQLAAWMEASLVAEMVMIPHAGVPLVPGDAVKPQMA